MTFWELAAKAEAEVERWPRWKRNAANLALVNLAPASVRGANEMTKPRKDAHPTLKAQVAAHDSEIAGLRDEIRGLRSEIADLRQRVVAKKLLAPRLSTPDPEPREEVPGNGTGLTMMNMPRGWRA